MTGRAILTPKPNMLNAACGPDVALGVLRQNWAPLRANGRSYRPNGKRECARRRRQITRGMLQVSG